MANSAVKDFRFKKKNKQKRWPGKHKKAGKRSGKKYFILVLIAVFVGLLIGGALLGVYKWLSGSEFFQITSIKIEGNRQLSRQQILMLSGVDIRTNLLAFDVKAARAKIESDGWVKSARVERKWPSDLFIKVRERDPVALIRGLRGLFYVDVNGVAFSPVNPRDDMDFPVISGLEKEVGLYVSGEVKSWGDKKEEIADILRFISYAGKGSSALPRQNISEINLAKDNGYVLYLADRPFPIYLGSQVSQKSYYRLAKVLYVLYKKREFSDVNFIRMDYMNDKVLVSKKNAG